MSPYLVMVGTLILEWATAIRRYHVVPRAPDDFLIEVVWRAERRQDLIERIPSAFASILGATVGVTVIDVDAIASPLRGKARLVESRVGTAGAA